MIPRQPRPQRRPRKPRHHHLHPEERSSTSVNIPNGTKSRRKMANPSAKKLPGNKTSHKFLPTLTGKLRPPWPIVTESFSQFWPEGLFLLCDFLLLKLNVRLSRLNLSLNEDILPGQQKSAETINVSNCCRKSSQLVQHLVP